MANGRTYLDPRPPFPSMISSKAIKKSSKDQGVDYYKQYCKIYHVTKFLEYKISRMKLIKMLIQAEEERVSFSRQKS